MNMSRLGFGFIIFLISCTQFRGDALTCDGDAFSCGGGDKCIPKQWTCDSEHDCVDGSDEMDCGSMNVSCNQMQFQCSSGRCLHKNWRCDGERDCRDGSDEANCGKREKCAAEMIRCDNGKCLSPAYVCDGDDDCGDRSDEKNCSRTCSPLHFQCVADSRCILKTWRCDGDRDCADGSDEKNCPTSAKKTCGEGEFNCGNGRCVPFNFVCDGDKDCDNERDERNCGKTTCPSSRFTCSDGKCILPGWRCDGENDCIDGIDEQNCTSVRHCAKDHFMCANSTYHSCIKTEKVCDGILDCPDASDESHCHVQNKTTECQVYDSFRCNGTDCERNTTMCDSCYALWTTELGKKRIVRQGCWTQCRSGDKCVGEKVKKKYMKNLTFCCCTGDNCNDIASPVNKTNCPEFRCKDGTCISAKFRCDGNNDCPNGDDETSCEKECLMNFEIKSVNSPQDTYSLKALKSFNVFLNNSVSAWCRRTERPGGWVTLDLGTIRTVSALTTSGYPVGTEPGFKNFTLQISGKDSVYLNYTENARAKVFIGNRNPLKKVKHLFGQLVKARYIRIFPMAFSNENFACLRVAVLGCNKAIVPEVKSNTKLVAPNIGEDGLASCTMRFQRDYTANIRWYMKQKSGQFEPLSTGHNHIITKKQLKLGTKFDLFAEKEIHLRFRFSFDYIKEMFSCKLEKTNDTFVCSAEYKCMATYPHLETHSAATVFVQYNFGKRIEALQLNATNVTENGVKLHWKVHPKPKYRLPVRAFLWITDGNRTPKSIVYSLYSSPFTLETLVPYHQYRTHLTIAPNTLPGIRKMIRSNEVVFTTLVSYPEELPSVKVVHIGSNYAIFQCKPPPKEKCNGPIDGYILTHKRIGYGGKPVDEAAKDTVASGQEIVRINDFKPSSTYSIRVIAYNLFNGKKLRSKEVRITMKTLSEKPTLVPNDVTARFEVPNSVEITWSVPINEQEAKFTGFKIRINEIMSKKRREKREASTHTRIIEVGRSTRAKTIKLLIHTEFCMIEVALYSRAGVGPFSRPVTIKIERIPPTTKSAKETMERTLPSSTIEITKASTSPETKVPGTTEPIMKSSTKESRKIGLNSKDTGKLTEEKRTFFIEFIVAVVAVACLLIIIAIVVRKMYKRKGEWNKENGYQCEARNMEPLIMDNESGNWNNEGLSVESMEYSRHEFKDKTQLSNF